MTRVAILQPSYLPWLGYFEQIATSDVFIFLDDVQYTRSDWRNRNRIKTRRGPAWITVPVRRRGLGQRINEALIDYTRPWPERHLHLLRENYGKAPWFDRVVEIVRPPLLARPPRLVDLNVGLVHDFMALMGITTTTRLASSFGIRGTDLTRRLIDLCRAAGATRLYEGAAGLDYLDLARFSEAGIEVCFQQYRHPVYEQFFPPFASHLSIVDLLFHRGPESRDVLVAETGQEAPP